MKRDHEVNRFCLYFAGKRMLNAAEYSFEIPSTALGRSCGITFSVHTVVERRLALLIEEFTLSWETRLALLVEEFSTRFWCSHPTIDGF